MTHALDQVRELCHKMHYIEANELLLQEVAGEVQKAHGAGSYQEAEVYFYHGYCLFMHSQERLAALGSSLCEAPIIRDALSMIGDCPPSGDDAPEPESPSSDSESEPNMEPVWDALEFSRLYFSSLISGDELSKELVAPTKVYLSVIHLILGSLELENGESNSQRAIEEFNGALDMASSAFSESHPYYLSLAFHIGQALSLFTKTIPEAIQFLSTTLEMLEKGSNLYSDTKRAREELKLLPLRGLGFYADVPASAVQAALHQLEVLAENPELLEYFHEEQPKLPPDGEEKKVAQFDFGVVGGNKPRKVQTTTIIFDKPKKITTERQKEKAQEGEDNTNPRLENKEDTPFFDLGCNNKPKKNQQQRKQEKDIHTMHSSSCISQSPKQGTKRQREEAKKEKTSSKRKK